MIKIGIERCIKEHAYDNSVYTSCPICNNANVFVKTSTNNLRNEIEYLHEGYKLNKQYVIEKVIQEDFMCITYLGFDSERKIRVLIDELYPLKLVFRNCYDSYNVKGVGQDGIRIFNKALALMTEDKGVGKYNFISVPMDCIKVNDTVYLIYNYLEWQSLEKYIQSKREELSANEIINMIKPFAKELQSLHQKNMYHGNISIHTTIVSGNDEILLARAAYVRTKLIKENLWQVAPFQDNRTLESVNTYIREKTSLSASQYQYGIGEVNYFNIEYSFDVLAFAIIIRELIQVGVNKTTNISKIPNTFKKDSEKKIKCLEFIDDYFNREAANITISNFNLQVFNILNSTLTPAKDKLNKDTKKINIDDDINEIEIKIKKRSHAIRVSIAITVIVVVFAVFIMINNG